MIAWHRGTCAPSSLDKAGQRHDLRRREAEPDPPGPRGEVLGDGALDHLEELIGSVRGPDGELLEELHHEAAEALEGAGEADLGGEGGKVL